ncbi:sigma-54 dependent transcriptional regulator [Geobacter sp.]|uniref:sigma-54-dependent transcriptional regulator n=1 Tax=Geobacter sp. TaxID=46610 RepID=UPI0026044D53|nr:sigma-54 dependent transcriptional regulator [Geobacter sp.]
MNHKVFICDDEEGMLRYLGKTIADWGFEIETFTSPLALLAALDRHEGHGDLLLLDIRMPEMDGISVLQWAKAACPHLGVIIMTGHGTIDSAVEAIKLGAFDYLTKPFPEERLSTAIRNCLERERLRAENLSLKKTLEGPFAPDGIVFRSEPFRKVYELARRVAASDANVLVLGESGTGKELIAGAIHYTSPRADRRFLTINCAALTETLLESQLFGHVRGAFTGAVQTHKGLLEEADGGSLFLDEVGELSAPLQVKLLRVLQEGEFIPVGATRPKRVDVRFIAATNRDLDRAVAEGAFREDLYYRLNVIALQLPPLRERPEDIEPLALHFLSRAGSRWGANLRGITPEALAALRDYPWPGNVRELQNVIERGVILAGGDQLTMHDLPLKVSRPAVAPGPAAAEPLTLRDAERAQVARILHRTRWNKSRTAQTLGITRVTLDRKIAEYGLSPEEA